MKKLSLFLLAILFFACEEQDITNGLQPLPTQEVPLPITNSRIIPPGSNDPNLNANWNWEGSEWTVWFRNVSGTISNPNGIGSVNPFYDISAVSIFGNADPSQIDIRASDGWMLVARDFGTPTAAPRLPWIMLYNKYRGLLRVCVFKTSELSDSHQTLTLSFDSGGPTAESFIFTETQQLAYSEVGNQQWMVGEFNMQGYDPSIAQQARLQVVIHGVEETLTYQEGGITLTGVAQPKPKPLGVSNLFDMASYSSKLYDKLPDFGNSTFKNVVKDLRKPELLEAAGGFIKSFTGSGKYPTYNISLAGSISLTGTMTQTDPIGSFGVYLRTDANNSGQYKAINSIPWGVMNYTEAVKVYVEESYPCDDEDDYYCREEIDYYTKSGFFDNILTINPAIASNIVNTEVGWIISGPKRVNFMSINTFKNGTRVPVPHGYNVVGVAVRLTYRNGDVVYNRIPIRLI
ncbi:hypothetical protein [Tunicatimonas pelagia]|uniref:hypothetical protein n=1 Tax=Tunicatimonas pelagia TaxID=931531 RepID=UPI0026653FF9|nr:hypothetical protein [Tunicatimonas pelagia]WKN42045.1 hypothetical protein P0M28_23690 [Tunicatimonas pelagia]